MKKLIKILLWTFCIIIAGALLAILTTPLWLGPVAASVANGLVPKYTGTPFKITKMHINPLSGNFVMEGFHLGNPAGYDAKDAVSLDKLSVSIAPFELLDNKLHVRNIDIIGPYVSYLGEKGTNNFDVILANLERNFEKKGEEAEEVKEEVEEKASEVKDEMKVKIDRFHIEGIRFKMGILPEMPIPIPVTLTDLGTKDDEGKEADGISLDEMGELLASKISEACSKAGGGIMGLLNGDAAKGLGNAMKGLGDEVKVLGGDVSKAADAATGAIKKLGTGDALKSAGKGVSDAAGAAGDAAGKATAAAADAAGKAADVATDAAKSVGEGAKNLLKGAGSLFGGDKKK